MYLKFAFRLLSKSLGLCLLFLLPWVWFRNAGLSIHDMAWLYSVPLAILVAAAIELQSQRLRVAKEQHAREMSSQTAANNRLREEAGKSAADINRELEKHVDERVKQLKDGFLKTESEIKKRSEQSWQDFKEAEGRVMFVEIIKWAYEQFIKGGLDARILVTSQESGTKVAREQNNAKPNFSVHARILASVLVVLKHDPWCNDPVVVSVREGLAKRLEFYVPEPQDRKILFYDAECEFESSHAEKIEAVATVPQESAGA
ncbi:MAG: hypothetical protein WCJ29_06165 [bacterium]